VCVREVSSSALSLRFSGSEVGGGGVSSKRGPNTSGNPLGVGKSIGAAPESIVMYRHNKVGGRCNWSINGCNELTSCIFVN